ncbi:hypothetical protein [Acidobacterium sp. S8]|uniref:hypothetical protein n=1 Tax=Acidobacterium sp. S8 TaxID=1641854 RepID=UPI00131DEC2F|nr:hypothetical protein [Acidobacterium sp. S8]
MSSQDVMRVYLERVGQLTRSGSGPEMMGTKRQTPTKEDSQNLRSLIGSQARTNRLVLFFALFLILVVFVCALISAVHSGGSSNSILAVAGIGTGAEAGLLAWVLHLWSEYNKFGFLLILSERLSPEDLMKAVLALFEHKRSRQSKDRFAAIESDQS